MIPRTRHQRHSANRDSIVSRVEAGVIKHSIYLHPVRLVDAATIPAGRRNREGRNDLDPPLLFYGDLAHLFGCFRKVLVLAEDEPDIVTVFQGEPHQVDSDPYVDPLFFRHLSPECSSISEPDLLLAIPHVAVKGLYSLPPHYG